MKNIIVFLTVFWLSLTSLPMALAQDYSEDIAQSIRLGVLLYEFDNSAWVATDALRKNKKAWTLYTETAEPKGWVTTETGENSLVTAFVAELNGKTVSIYEAETKGREVLTRNTFPLGRELNEEEASQLRAKSKLYDSDITICEEFLPLNVIATPTEDDKDTYLYVMSSTQQSGLAVMGKHHRLRIADAGTRISETTSFSNSCLALPTRGEDGMKPVAIIITHLKTPYPQEHHVFTSLSHDLPIIVSMPNESIAWKVDGANIEPYQLDAAAN